MYFDEFARRVADGKFPPACALCGTADDVREEAFRLLKEAWVRSGGSGEFGDASSAELLAAHLEAARSPSLFTTRRLIALRGADKALGGRSEEPLRRLSAYLEDPEPSILLVLEAPGLRRGTRVYKLLESRGWLVEAYPLAAWKIHSWLRARARERGLELSEDAVAALLEKVGPHLGMLESALSTLEAFVHPNRQAGREQVLALPVSGVEPDVFEWVDAAASRRAEQALRRLSELPAGRERGLLPLLIQRLRDLAAAASLKESGAAPGEVARRLGCHPFRAKMLLEQAARWTPWEAERAYAEILDLQVGVMSGRIGATAEKVLLERWILRRAGQDERGTVRSAGNPEL